MADISISLHGWALALTVMLAIPVTAGLGTSSSESQGEKSRSSAESRGETLARQRAQLALPRSKGDGQGSAYLAETGVGSSVTAGGTGHWTFVFEAGGKGISAGGAIYFFAPHYWKWSPPQIDDVTAPGYTTVTPEDPSRELLLSTTRKLRLLKIEIVGKRLRRGEQISVNYGVGVAEAVADIFTEREADFWFAVDGDGDGHPFLLAEPISIEVLPGPAARLSLIWPSTARPGETIRLTAALLDRFGNAGMPSTTEIQLSIPPGGPALPASLHFEPGDRGRRTLEAQVGETGVFRVRAISTEGLEAESNPLVVGPGRRVLWADLHGHTNFSDGTGTPHDYFEYARDIAALDAISLTDHDHQGSPLPGAYLDQNPDKWKKIVADTEDFHEQGRFVTLPGFEWTSWTHGHRHVLYFAGGAEIFSNIDRKYSSPPKLWKALRGRDAITIAHHSAGGPVPTDWSFVPDPEMEPVTEVLSVHGSSEADDLPNAIYNPVPGNFVRDVLDRGMRFGFVGSGDSHDGHPGFAHLSSPRGGGLAAILSEDLTREGILEALRARRVYATNGVRILLRVQLSGLDMGSTLCVSRSGSCSPVREGPFRLVVEVAGYGPLDRIELIRPGGVAETIAGENRLELAFEREISEVRNGAYLYVRAFTTNNGLAISSPFFFD